MGKLGSYYDKLSAEDRLFVSHIADMAEICEKKYISRFSAFLDIKQVNLAESVINHYGNENHMFYGGFENASRVVLGVFPPYDECDKVNFPIKCISFKYHDGNKLSHRDFLGAFMSCGLNRNMIGDIIINDGYTLAFVYASVADTIMSEVQKVGSVGVKSSLEENPVVNVKESFSEISGTVSSMRADSVVSLAVRLSREKAAQLIRGGNVSLNCDNDISVSSEIKCGDVFSVRGYGKFILSEINGKTKKDRLHISIKKYI